MWYTDMLVGTIVSLLWILGVLILSQGSLTPVNSKRTHRKSQITTHERRMEPHHENPKEKV